MVFGTKQRSPANLDATIAATIELEYYLSHKASPVLRRRKAQIMDKLERKVFLMIS